MQDLSFDDSGRFVLTNFSDRSPFASFLPGIAGPMGIPMWVFYVNRGQAIASFGIGSKDNPVMEFQPANKAYQTTPFTGFRTFIKRDGGSFYEPFSPYAPAQRDMHIGLNELELEETAPGPGLHVRVLYFTLTNEPLAGLVRQVTITNTAQTPAPLTVLDGLPLIIPYGVNNTILKEISRTAEAWMEVFNLEYGIPFYRVRASIADTPEVQGYTAGHFYTTFTAETRLRPVVDLSVIFGQDTSLSHPSRFITESLDNLYCTPQATVGKTPCGFFGTSKTLAPGEALTLYAIIGHASDMGIVNRESARLCDPAFIEHQRRAADTLASRLADTVAIKTSNPLLDGYTRQTFLDNVIRGGWPVLLGDAEQPFVYHLYSRKHGDLERDYNAFYVAPEFYSQGNGNYRDVNQNRREDVWFNPAIKDFNVTAFMNLIQADGYNPLVIQGCRFTVPENRRAAVLALADEPTSLEAVLSHPFTPGELLKQVTVRQIKLHLPVEDFLSFALRQADQHFEADFGEGYWIDHWTYNLDLIENYLAIYPERQHELLFEKAEFTFYDSVAIVQPRDNKYLLREGRVRQLHAVKEDKEKEALIKSRSTLSHAMRLDHGRGEVYRTTLLVKLLCLAVNKFATLDPLGMGIEMEAGRPGWYDALNGLPALFGSSMPETFELARLLAFLLTAITDQEGQARIPIEVYDLIQAAATALDTYHDSQEPERDHLYWDAVATAREIYREQIRLGFAGQFREMTFGTLEHLLGQWLQKVRQGIERALAMNGGLPPTYLTYQPEQYEVLDPTADQDTRYVRIRRFAPTMLPLFLEGPVRALKTTADPVQAQHLHQQVKASPLFDRTLKMYKVNASLAGQPQDIGRARAFTPGWLENESIWLHMEYKYLYALLKAGLYTEFYEDLKNVLIPFQDPAIYGRSPLENSSFIVSSAHPDPLLHGRGFVARLSGSTVEFLSILHAILIGHAPFFVRDNQLQLAFKPALAGWLFDETGTISFKFLGAVTVTYHNPQRRDTFGEQAAIPCKHTLELLDGQVIEIAGAIIPAPYANLIRRGGVTAIRVALSVDTPS